MRVWRTEHGREQALQAADQNVRLATALGQFLDLRILRGEFLAKERNLAFQAADVSLGEVGRRFDAQPLEAGDGAAVSDEEELRIEATAEAEVLVFDLA